MIHMGSDSADRSVVLNLRQLAQVELQHQVAVNLVPEQGYLVTQRQFELFGYLEVA